MEFTNRTKENISELKNIVKKKLSNKILEIVNDESISLFQRWKKILYISNKCNIGGGELKEIVGHKFEIPHNTLFAHCYYLKLADFPSMKYFYHTGRLKKSVRTVSGSLNVSLNTIVIINDDNKNILNKVRKILNENNSNPHLKEDKIVLVIDKKEEQVLFDKGFDASDVIYSSSIIISKKPKTNNIRYSNCNNCSLLTFDGYSLKKVGHHLSAQTNDGLFIFDDHFGAYTSYAINEFGKFIKSGKNIYIFTRKQYSKLKIEQRNFINVLDKIIKSIEDNKQSYIKYYTYKRIVQYKPIDKLANLTSTNNMIQNLSDKYKCLEINLDNLYHYDILIHSNPLLYAEITDGINKLYEEYEKDRSDVIAKYPLIKYMFDVYYIDDYTMKEFAFYVDSVENRKAGV